MYCLSYFINDNEQSLKVIRNLNNMKFLPGLFPLVLTIIKLLIFNKVRYYFLKQYYLSFDDSRCAIMYFMIYIFYFHH